MPDGDPPIGRAITNEDIWRALRDIERECNKGDVLLATFGAEQRALTDKVDRAQVAQQKGIERIETIVVDLITIRNRADLAGEVSTENRQRLIDLEHWRAAHEPFAAERDKTIKAIAFRLDEVDKRLDLVQEGISQVASDLKSHASSPHLTSDEAMIDRAMRRRYEANNASSLTFWRTLRLDITRIPIAVGTAGLGVIVGVILQRFFGL